MRAFLGLGSNVGDRAGHLRDALAAMAPEVVAVSDAYETEPVGGPEQGRFLNLVVELETERDARGLLELAHGLEAAALRMRDERWGPRTLDVDVLWVGSGPVDEPDLQVPHPRMGERRFVLAPLSELASELLPDRWEERAVGEVARLGPLGRLPGGPRVRIVGRGRAGSALALALQRVGWDVAESLGRRDDVTDAAAGVDLLVLATPDGVLAEVARQVRPERETVVAHLAGSRGLDVLEPHTRRAAVHPLVALPDAELGAARLLARAWFAVAGDPMAVAVVDALGGRWFEVADEHRAAYHAAACIASNHLVALLGQVERVAAEAGVPLAAYLDLVRATLDNVAALGPAAALTGPAARGDWETIERHRAALDPFELEAYDALVRAARRLVEGEA